VEKISVSELKRRPGDVIAYVVQTGKSIVVTVNGHKMAIISPIGGIRG